MADKVSWHVRSVSIFKKDDSPSSHEHRANLRAFSTRRAEILEATGQNASARSMQVAALATRKLKEPDVGHGELLVRWRSRAREIGLDRETMARTFDPEAPEQLGEIEAGGLFRALAERADPIHLDEVIRHRHELDREAAKQIREGEGREALSLYQSSERVTVAPNAEERRAAMVRDWHEAFERSA
jgi:AAA domain-containing protein/TrwC relaxase